MYKLFLYVQLSMSFFVSSINAQLPSTSTSHNSPIISPPNPEAYSFTKYGDLPIGHFTGTFQYSIPLYTITTGKLSHDISLSYSTNGLRVDEISGNVGMGWTLNSGGIIHRSVLDKPDNLNDLMLWPWLSYDPSEDSWEFWNYIRTFGLSQSADLQPDEYIYKTANMNGKFHLSRDGTFKQFRYTGTKISGDGVNGFILTDTDGTMFYFTCAESSRNYNIGDELYPEFSNNSWHLKKILSVFGDSIVFNYVHTIPQTVQYLTGISQNYNAILTANTHTFYRYQGLYAGYMEGEGCINEGLHVVTKVNVNEVQTNYLSSIDFNEGSINFYYSNREDVPSDLKIDSITIKRINDNKKIKTYTLFHKYSNSFINENNAPHLKKRLFLDSLCQISYDQVSKMTHSFEYDSIDLLPPRLSFSQDKYGFSNGKENNYFFPKDTWIDIFLQGTHIGGDRSYDFRMAKKGTLNKIIYPSKGYSNIEYEPNRLNNSGDLQLHFDTAYGEINPSIYQNQIAESDTFFKDSRPIRFKIICDWQNGPPEFFPDAYYIGFSIINTQTNECEYICDRPISPSTGGYWNSTDLNWNLSAGSTYKIRLQATLPGIVAKVYVERENLVFDSSFNTNGTAGLRIKSITNYADNINTPFSKKEFLYCDWDQPNGFSGRGINDITYNNLSWVTVIRKTGSSFNYLQDGYNKSYCGYNVIQSNSAFNLYKSDQSTLIYPKVIELNEYLNKNNGGIEYEFIVDANNANQPARPLSFFAPTYVWDFSPITITGVPYSNFDFLTGKLKSIKKFSYANKFGDRKIINEIKNYYSVDQSNFQIDSFYAVNKVIDLTTIITNPSWKQFSAYDINKYYRHYSWVKMDSTVSKSYSDNSQQGYLTIKNSYNYSSNNFKPIEEKSVNSEGVSIITQTKYPADFPISYTELPMVFANVIDKPVEVTVRKNSFEIKRDKYKYVNNNLIEILCSINGLPPIKELEFQQFDSKGNLLQFTNKDGIVTSFLWGYNKQYPVAKIFGATYSTCSNWVIQSNIDNSSISDNQMRIELNYIRSGLANTNALVTTYTYSPLVGLTSETDANGSTKYYEYDNFNRLSIIRDQDQNILKKICYNYAGIVENCN